MSPKGRRLLLGVLLACALAAGLAGAGIVLWQSSVVPRGLPHPQGSAAGLLAPAAARRAASYSHLTFLLQLGSEAAVLVALGVYAFFGARFARESAAGRIGTGMLLAMLGFGVVWFARLPFAVAELWWARRHGLSHDGYAGFVFGNWLALGSTFVFVCLAILVVMALAGPLRGRWWVPGVVVFASLSLLATFVTPYLIPGTRPLRDPELRAATARFASEQGLPTIPVEVQDASASTSAPNAEAVGLGPTRRIVLWDTLLDGRFSTPEIEFVLAHELGHQSRQHLWKNVAWYALFAVPLALAIALATRRRGGMHKAEAVPLALLVFAVVQFASLPLRNAVTRHLEAEADWVGLTTTRNPAAARGAFTGLLRASLEEPSPPTWAYVLFENHPTIAQRIGMTRAWEARAAGTAAR